ncbi:MAG: hypothetical protein ACE15C_08035 [Phycisphaerae bacterium]
MFVISCHADTGFESHRLERLAGGLLCGHLHNFAGVYAVMRAFFSGRLNREHVRVELTWGEERGLLGAKDLVGTLNRDDLIAVVDVTGSPTEKAVSIEKCRSPRVREFLAECLAGLSCTIHEGCPDPVSTVDEADVYFPKCPYTFFLGIPVRGGDYNAGVCICRQESIDAASEAICRIAEGYGRFRPAG